MFDPTFEYVVVDLESGDPCVYKGHQVGELVIREITEPFIKDMPLGQMMIDHGFALEHWGLPTGIATYERFETALFIADAISLDMPSETFETVEAFYAWLSGRRGWLVATKRAGDAGEPMQPLRAWHSEQKSAVPA